MNITTQLREQNFDQSDIVYYVNNKDYLDSLMEQDDILTDNKLAFHYLEQLANEKIITPKSIKYEFNRCWEKLCYDENNEFCKAEFSGGKSIQFDDEGKRVFV